MNKICTSIEQSKKLIELGIDVNTADMCWSIDIPDLPTLLAYPITDCDNWENKIPAWSLSALLELLPDELQNNHFLTLEKENNEYCCCYEDNNGNSFNHFFGNTAIDAAFEMVCWLLENEKL